MYWKIEIAVRGLPISFDSFSGGEFETFCWDWCQLDSAHLSENDPTSDKSICTLLLQECCSSTLLILWQSEHWELYTVHLRSVLYVKSFIGRYVQLVNHANCRNCDDWCHYRVESKVLQCFERVLGCHAMASIQTHSLAVMPAERIMLMVNLQRAQLLQFN